MTKLTKDMLTEDVLAEVVKHKLTKEEKRNQMVSFVMSGLGDDYPKDEVALEKKRREIYDRLKDELAW